MTTLASFAQTNGATPLGGLTFGNDGALYGTTESGGAMDWGTVFRVTTNGELTTLWSLSWFYDAAAWLSAGVVQGDDGAFYGTSISGVFRVVPGGVATNIAAFPALTNGLFFAALSNPLVKGPDGALYGTHPTGGDYGFGSVFRIMTNGLLTTLASFHGTNEAGPSGPLAIGPDGALYGTTQGNWTGNDAWGTIFRATTNGVLTILYVFDYWSGAAPLGGLVFGSDDRLYGTTGWGGAFDCGTIFQATTNGQLKTLASLGPSDLNGFDTRLVQGLDGTFYGTADFGGTNNIGGVFRISADGVLTNIFTFTNSEGSYPRSGLVATSDGELYGTAPMGGSENCGAIFRVATDGAVTTVASFSTSDTGSSPYGGLIQGQDGAMYGTTSWTLFRLPHGGPLTRVASFDFATNGWDSYGSLAQGSDGAFYGTMNYGGIGNFGTVFRATTNGVVTTLVSFVGTNGAMPSAGLVQSCDGAFYGTTTYGGPDDTNYLFRSGTIFRVTTNGVLTTLKAFTDQEWMSPSAGLALGDDCALYGTIARNMLTASTNLFRITTDGTFTIVATVPGLSAGTLFKGQDGAFYGATAAGSGTVFRVTTNGVVTTLLSANSPNTWTPAGSLAAGPDGYLYGTTSGGGAYHAGSIFRAKMPDPRPRMLSISFPCGYPRGSFTGLPGQTYRVQKTTNLLGPWQTLVSVTLSADGVGWFNDYPLSPRSFYRVVAP